MADLRTTFVAVGLVAVMLGLALAPNGAAQPSSQETNGAQELPRPILNTHELMELFNEQWFEYAQAAMQDEPQKEQDWKTIEERGLQAAEIMNLVAIRKQAEKHPKVWAEKTRDAQRAGLDLAAAARTKELARTKEAWRQLIGRCNSCHRTIAPDHAPQLEP